MTLPLGPTLVRHLRVSALAADPTPDGELARRFHADGDQDAFELLVRRHAPTVLRVCRAVVGDTHLAEDAAQAVFLVLARKARTVAGVRSAAGWLARVAYRAANRARARAARRPTVSVDAEAVADTPDPVEAAVTAERVAIVQREMNRLPDKYHAPIVLCYFEGLTITRAADRLGWPAGTVAGRLARGRALLRGRLARRGLAVPVAGLTAILGRPERAAAVATAVAHTVRGGTVIPPAVGELANEVIKAMGTTRRVVCAATMVLGLVGAAVMAGTDDPPPKPADGPPAAAAPRKNEFIVIGKVADETGKVPMEGVRVWASAGMGTLRPTGETTTDKDGNFRLVFGPGLLMAGGKVGGQVGIVHASKPGYFAWTYGWPAEYLLADDPPPAGTDSSTRRTVLTPGKETRLEFRMAPAATLRARLTGPDGRPMANARVWLTGKDLPPGSSVLAQGRTDADGVWTVQDLRRGQFRLVIDDPREQWGELELGSIRFTDPVEYAVEAVVHAWTTTETSASFQVTRPAK